MQYRIDKRSGAKLSVLGLGCMRFPRTLGRIDHKKTEELIMRSIDGGINYFDTAWFYPGSEETLGAILEKNRIRREVHISDKLPLLFVKSGGDFDKYFEQQLARLRTDYIDYYLMHMLTSLDQWERLRSWGIEEWIAGKKKADQVGRIGFSFHGPRDEFLKIIDDYDWDTCMIQYNYSEENYQAGVTGLRKAALNMPVVVMEPLLGGKLATGLPAAAVQIFKKADPALSPAGWALNWIWNQEEASVVLSGMSNIKQLEENLRLADAARPGMLKETEAGVYRDVLEFVNRSNKIRCTNCNYCMPCPRGVNIPGCFSAYNASYSLGYMEGVQQYAMSTGFILERGSGPDLCVKCGICEPHCPQHLPIMSDLALVRKRLEPFWVRLIGACTRTFLGKKRKKTER